MRLAPAALAFLLAACASQSPVMPMPSPPPPSPETLAAQQEELRRLEQSLVRAIQARNQDALRELLAPDFSFRGPLGAHADRSGFLASVASIPGTLLSVEVHPVQADVYGDTGVLTGTQHSRVRLPDGTEVTDVQHFTDVCQKRRGRWWVVLAHSVPATPESIPSTASSTAPAPAGTDAGTAAPPAPR